MTAALPPELWWRILRLLPGPSLCQVSLVCRYFHTLVQVHLSEYCENREVDTFM